jgi:hypothetical protein
MRRWLLLSLALLLVGCGQQPADDTPRPVSTAEVPWREPAARWDTGANSAFYRIGYTCYVAQHAGAIELRCFPLIQGANE